MSSKLKSSIRRSTKFSVLTDADWQRELRRARAVKNDISEQIKAMLKYIQYESERLGLAYEVQNFNSQRPIGYILKQPDGFFYFVEEYGNPGAPWSSLALKDLAYKIEALNVPEVQRQLKEAIDPGSHAFTD